MPSSEKSPLDLQSAKALVPKARAKAIEFLKERDLLPPSWHIDGVYQEIAGEAGDDATDRVVAFTIFVRRQFDRYRGLGAFNWIGITLSPSLDVTQVDYNMEESERWAGYPTRSVDEAFSALNRGSGQLLPEELWGGRARFERIIYLSETERHCLVQPVYAFRIEKGKVAATFYAPAIVDAWYVKTPAFVHKWDRERISDEELGARVRERVALIRAEEKAIQSLPGVSRGELSVIYERQMKCANLWREAADSVTAEMRDEFVAAGLDSARACLFAIRRHMTERNGGLGTYLDCYYWDYSRKVLEVLSSIPGSKIDPDVFLSQFEKEHEWLIVTEKPKEDPPNATQPK